MSRLLPTEPVPVRIGDCECPGTPHPDGDFAYLRPRLTAGGGLAATQAILNNLDDTITMARAIGLIFLSDGIVRWDLLDDDGKPIPHDLATLTSGALSWEETLLPLADEADKLYAASVLAPFRPAKAPKSSPIGRTGDSTSANQDS